MRAFSLGEQRFLIFKTLFFTILSPTIGCYYEEDGLEGGYQMRFVRFSLEWLTDGTDSIESDNFGTAIEEVKTENGEVKTIYDLQGRKVTQPVNGIYIVNGKKTFIK